MQHPAPNLSRLGTLEGDSRTDMDTLLAGVGPWPRLMFRTVHGLGATIEETAQHHSLPIEEARAYLARAERAVTAAGADPATVGRNHYKDVPEDGRLALLDLVRNNTIDRRTGRMTVKADAT